MKVVIAFNSFKGSLSSIEACQIASEVIAATRPRIETVSCPLADGGEGTAEVLRRAMGGSWVPCRTMGPLPGSTAESGFVWIPDRQLAIVEMAKSSGLTLLPVSARDPWRTTTFGTGELMRAAMEQGATEIWLCVGGSATVDGGVGAAMALGWRFLNEEGKPLGLGGGELLRLHAIIPPENRDFPVCRVLCDVRNTLLGPRGAARAFGPQKGATPEQVDLLEKGLRIFADTVRRDYGLDITSLEGGGAAGGLAAGAALFFSAQLTSGIEAVFEATRFAELAKGACWVLTGEGRFDEQSLEGKAFSGVAAIAQHIGAKLAVIAGKVALPEAAWRDKGVEYVAELAMGAVSVEEAVANARTRLAAAVSRFCTEAL